jgi:hypothetical protein
MLCNGCKQDLDDSEFYFRNKAKRIRNYSRCKKCQSIYTTRYYYKNHEKSIQDIKDRREKMKTWFKEFKKDLVCINCGESTPCCLDLHHMNSEEKDRGVSRLVADSCSIERIKSEIDKCIVLCSNCHKKLHAGFLEIKNMLL